MFTNVFFFFVFKYQRDLVQLVFCPKHVKCDLVTCTGHRTPQFQRDFTNKVTLSSHTAEIDLDSTCLKLKIIQMNACVSHTHNY